MSHSEVEANAILAGRLGASVGTKLLGFVHRGHDDADSSLYSIVRSYLVQSTVKDIAMAPAAGRSPWGDAYHE